jgi:hypothetical protein
MDIGSILLILALLILVAVFVFRPVLERKSVLVSEEDQSESALLAERDRILDAIQELDFDHTMGKIPPDDYPGQRTQLLQRGADVLRQLDAARDDAFPDSADARLEAVILARNALPVAADGQELPPQSAPEKAGPGAPSALPSPDDQLENLISARRQAQQGKAAGFCHRCGQTIKQNDRFCANCGATI